MAYYSDLIADGIIRSLSVLSSQKVALDEVKHWGTQAPEDFVQHFISRINCVHTQEHYTNARCNLEWLWSWCNSVKVVADVSIAKKSYNFTPRVSKGESWNFGGMDMIIDLSDGNKALGACIIIEKQLWQVNLSDVLYDVWSVAYNRDGIARGNDLVNPRLTSFYIIPKLLNRILYPTTICGSLCEKSNVRTHNQNWLSNRTHSNIRSYEIVEPLTGATNVSLCLRSPLVGYECPVQNYKPGDLSVPDIINLVKIAVDQYNTVEVRYASRVREVKREARKAKKQGITPNVEIPEPDLGTRLKSLVRIRYVQTTSKGLGTKHSHHFRPVEHIRSAYVRHMSNGSAVNVRSTVVNKGISRDTRYKVI